MSGFCGFLVIVGGLALLRLTKYQLRSDPSGKHTIVTTTIIAFGLMAAGILLMSKDILNASASDYAEGLVVICVLPALMMITNELLLKMIVSDIGATDRRKHKSKRKNDWIATKPKRGVR